MRTEWEKQLAWANRFITKVRKNREAEKTMNKIMTAIKSINVKDLLSRAAWTFVQGFLAVVLLSSEQLVELLFSGNLEALRAFLYATLVGGIAGGVSALKTAVLTIVKKYKTL